MTWQPRFFHLFFFISRTRKKLWGSGDYIRMLKGIIIQSFGISLYFFFLLSLHSFNSCQALNYFPRYFGVGCEKDHSPPPISLEGTYFCCRLDNFGIFISTYGVSKIPYHTNLSLFRRMKVKATQSVSRYISFWNQFLFVIL